MKINKDRAQRNIDYARRWLSRALKDFALFKKIVPFDKRTDKPVRCSDPALAVYLLQQSVEKAVKAAAIASGQYKTKDFTLYYRHNSLALIINLNNKIVAKIKTMGLESVTKMIGVDLSDGESKLSGFESQIMGIAPLLNKDGGKVDFKSESISLAPKVIDQILDMIIRSRSLTLDIIRTTFNLLPKMGIHKGHEAIDDPDAFLRNLADLIASSNPKLHSPSEEQLKAPIEFVKHMMDAGVETSGELSRKDTTMNYLGVWAFSIALLLLTYITYAHESTSRYPLKQRGDIRKGDIGCDDYDENLGIVNRIGKIGYVTSLTLNDIKDELDSLALFFTIGQDRKKIRNKQ
ncbi:hypothetical protein ES704_01827 [subsurface metagenome]|jgi:hypothetical protein